MEHKFPKKSTAGGSVQQLIPHVCIGKKGHFSQFLVKYEVSCEHFVQVRCSYVNREHPSQRCCYSKFCQPGGFHATYGAERCGGFPHRGLCGRGMQFLVSPLSQGIERKGGEKGEGISLSPSRIPRIPLWAGDATSGQLSDSGKEGEGRWEISSLTSVAQD